MDKKFLVEYNKPKLDMQKMNIQNEKDSHWHVSNHRVGSSGGD